jgi:hypothetical protein
LGEDTNSKENDYQYNFIHNYENFFHIEKKKNAFRLKGILSV